MQTLEDRYVYECAVILCEHFSFTVLPITTTKTRI